MLLTSGDRLNIHFVSVCGLAPHESYTSCFEINNCLNKSKIWHIADVWIRQEFNTSNLSVSANATKKNAKCF